MSLDRRRFLQTSLGGAAGLAYVPDMLRTPDRQGDRRQVADRPILVVLQLRGGNDGLNTIVPFEDDAYFRARPTIALPKKSLLPLDKLNGFHPALDKLAARFGKGEVAIIQGVGYPGANLSHFRSQDIWDAGNVAEPLPSTGWLGRFCDTHLDDDFGPVTMVAVGRDRVPHAMRAVRGVACAVANAGSYRIRGGARGVAAGDANARMRAVEAMNRPAEKPADERNEADRQDNKIEPLTDAARAARLSVAQIAAAGRFKSRAKYPGTRLAQDLRLVAQIIGHGLPTRACCVTQDGYDTHVRQLVIHERLLGQLDAALDAFLTDLAAQGNLDRTVVMTISDFGRRAAESGIGTEAGTDHGAGSMMMLVGGRVSGGIYGDQPDLSKLDTNGNLVLATDFRQVYAAVTEDWLGGESKKVLGRPFDKLKLFHT
jgi:uncharacterized protein (DUF1501 family)